VIPNNPTPKKKSPAEIAAAFAEAFRDARHHPFIMTGSTHGGAALLVHGFPGTPAEMRPLAHILNREGWTTQGILLPGFGTDIESLPRRKVIDWLRAVDMALIELQRERRPVLLIGNSMGGALSIQIAAARKPDGLLLINPFWQLNNILWKTLPVLKFALPQFKPFRLMKLDFNDPETLKGIAGFIPGADLRDPEVQSAIRNFAIPTGMLDQLRLAGVGAGNAAPHVTTPTLVIQGANDPLVTPVITRQLVAKIAGAGYQEIPGDHNLLDPALPTWRKVEALALDFAWKIRTGAYMP